jgi:hypothetical protein
VNVTGNVVTGIPVHPGTARNAYIERQIRASLDPLTLYHSPSSQFLWHPHP